MWEVGGQLDWKDVPYAFNYGFSLTSFQFVTIDPSDAQTQNPRNVTQNIHRPHTQNIYMYLVAMYIGKITQLTAR